MLKYPTTSGRREAPSGVFIGDKHDELYHLVQLTASISELVTHGVQVLFIEAFYYKSPPVATDVRTLSEYIKRRDFEHVTSEIGKRELPILYSGLIQRCKRASIPVLGVDAPLPPYIATIPKIMVRVRQKMIFRTIEVNNIWKKNIEDQCNLNNWRNFALFGGQVHATALSKLFGDRITAQIWDRAQKQYKDL